MEKQKCKFMNKLKSICAS